MSKVSTSESDDRQVPQVREAIDAESHAGLKADPADGDAKLDVALDASFPTSDAPANTRPGTGDPAPSSGYDEAAERWMARGSAVNAFVRTWRRSLLVGVGMTAGAALAASWFRRRTENR